MSEALGGTLTYTALKGYDNYPCLRKIAQLMRRGTASTPAAVALDEAQQLQEQEGSTRRMPEPSAELLDAIAAALGFATQSAVGDVTSLGVRWGKIQHSDLTSTSSECQKRRTWHASAPRQATSS